MSIYKIQSNSIDKPFKTVATYRGRRSDALAYYDSVPVKRGEKKRLACYDASGRTIENIIEVEYR